MVCARLPGAVVAEIVTATEPRGGVALDGSAGLVKLNATEVPTDVEPCPEKLAVGLTLATVTMAKSEAVRPRLSVTVNVAM